MESKHPEVRGKTRAEAVFEETVLDEREEKEHPHPRDENSANVVGGQTYKSTNLSDVSLTLDVTALGAGPSARDEATPLEPHSEDSEAHSSAAAPASEPYVHSISEQKPVKEKVYLNGNDSLLSVDVGRNSIPRSSSQHSECVSAEKEKVNVAEETEQHEPVNGSRDNCAEERREEVRAIYAKLPLYRFPCDSNQSQELSQTFVPSPAEATTSAGCWEMGACATTARPAVTAGKQQCAYVKGQQLRATSDSGLPHSQSSDGTTSVCTRAPSDRATLPQCLHNALVICWNTESRWLVVTFCTFLAFLLTLVAHPLSLMDVVGGGCYTFWGYKNDCDKSTYTYRTGLLKCVGLRRVLSAGVVFNILAIILLAAASGCCILFLKRDVFHKWNLVVFVLLCLTALVQLVSWMLVVTMFLLRFCEDTKQPRRTAYGVAFGMNVTSWILVFVSLVVMKVFPQG
ncbi:amastin-like protein, putative [Trypanosoma brucei gambiense DAL972]|uniref:Amastin-like protein, putative n=1 Tax=Trypanosoma brucei gambiense (strain MHOM/CI/86/DAL972) TaxID=679716 RepID=D0A843_TRYB9|nr:amastin-like protein, putative [Trypanosoma brucei gambiense DAL972]CBH17844.1 amastin-like protein, putative [Trypanosoma brucei gambiense DAL972]|eukprot:XP_011780108.1 amastin-like protein, putative [Trypanosoma brucei gambiense DAL972]